MRRYSCQELHLHSPPCTSHIRLICEGGSHLSGSLTTLCMSAVGPDHDCTSGSHHTAFRTVAGVCAHANPADTSLLSVSADLAQQLDCGVIPELLRNRFAQRGILLSEQASIRVRQCSRLWIITDQNSSFLIRKRSSQLAVFQEVG